MGVKVTGVENPALVLIVSEKIYLNVIMKLEKEDEVTDDRKMKVKCLKTGR